MPSWFARGKSAKVSGAKAQGSRDSCLGKPAGGFGLSWLKVVLGMKTMPPPNYFFLSLLPGSVRESGRAQHKRKERRRLDSVHVERTQWMLHS
ncbi:hypothetical protein LI328DRAFT_28157 [Trichoderma asperelloides]|nr:hypothetical protein LI328DRAFT_28157 [Trichoderma asperelloides]